MKCSNRIDLVVDHVSRELRVFLRLLINIMSELHKIGYLRPMETHLEIVYSNGST